MPALIKSAALKGIEAVPIDIEVDVLKGLPSYTVVGLTDKAIQESRERLTAALTNLGFDPPRRKTIVSLAPASLKKEGSHYDLPIALGFLQASKQISWPASRSPAESSDSVRGEGWFIGELGLDGTIRPVPGVLPILLAAEKTGVKEVFVPKGNSSEASAVANKIRVYTPESMQELLGHLSGEGPKLEPLAASSLTKTDWNLPEVDLQDIKGQDHAKRALTVAAAGGHNVLMVGPPGTGKTMLARALAGILPSMTREEALTVTSLYSVAGELSGTQGGLVTNRPFRSPHYGASSVALVGGGTNPKPGEVSLAHAGVLFLDELPEFPRAVLDQLRQPIEDGVVTVARAAQTVQYPAQVMLVGAMNPCKCGFIGSQKRDCRCSPGEVLRYQRKISGPLLDRFDLHVPVTDISVDDVLSSRVEGPTSEYTAKEIVSARNFSQERQGKSNAELKARELKRHCRIDGVSEKLLKKAEGRFHLSARGVHRLLKTARTIADLSGSKNIESAHLAEALQYREQLQQYLPEFV